MARLNEITWTKNSHPTDIKILNPHAPSSSTYGVRTTVVELPIDLQLPTVLKQKKGKQDGGGGGEGGVDEPTLSMALMVRTRTRRGGAAAAICLTSLTAAAPLTAPRDMSAAKPDPAPPHSSVQAKRNQQEVSE